MEIHNVVMIYNDAAYVGLQIELDEGYTQINIDPKCTLTITVNDHGKLVVEVSE